MQGLSLPSAINQEPKKASFRPWDVGYSRAKGVIPLVIPALIPGRGLTIRSCVLRIVGISAVRPFLDTVSLLFAQIIALSKGIAGPLHTTPPLVNMQ